MKCLAPDFLFTPRWSTIGLATALLAVGLGSFMGGRFFNSNAASTRVSASTGSRSATLLFLPSAGPVNSAIEPTTAVALQSRWAELLVQPQNPSTESALTKVIEELAQSDPQRAISLSVDHPNLHLRTTLLRAALRGWGRSQPAAAAVWADAQTTLERTDAIDTVLQGAISDPEGPTKVLQALSAKGPAHEPEDGGSVIAALAEAGQFERAAALAARGKPTNREDWLLRAYSRWAEFQPVAATERAMQLDDPALRAVALDAAVVGWARTDPRKLIEYASANFAPDQQPTAVANAISYWASADPVGAAAWMSQNDPGAAADTGMAEIALSPQLAQSPRVAGNWAEIISNPQLRFETVKTVLNNWPREDIASARNFLVTCRGLAPEERMQLSAGLETIE